MSTLKDNVVILIAPYRSHAIGTLKLADNISKNFNVIYVSASLIGDVVQPEGYDFRPILLNHFHPPIGAKDFFRTLINWIVGSPYNDFFNECSNILRVIKETNPRIIMIDAFLTRYYPLLKEIDRPVFVLQTMLVCNKSTNNPPPNANFIPAQNIFSPIYSEFLWQLFLLKKRFISVALRIASLNTNNDASTKKFKHYNGKLFDTSTFGHPRIHAAPEIILSSKLLNYPWVKYYKNQIHFGPSVHAGRHQALSESLRNFISDAKHQGNKLIYCSFGSVIKKRAPSFNLLLNNLVKIIRRNPGWYLLVAHPSPNELRDVRCLCVSFVPQLAVLQHADVMITHGGLNSIQECIKLEVPMLLYPFDNNSDRQGNAKRIEFYQLGLTGKLRESEHEVERKLTLLFADHTFKENLTKFNERISKMAEEDEFMRWLENIT